MVHTKASKEDLAARLGSLMREVPNFPQPGVLFRDLAPVFADATAFRAVVDALIAPAQQVDVVIGIEARGFLLGAAAAYALDAGVVGVRNPANCPWSAIRRVTPSSTVPPRWNWPQASCGPASEPWWSTTYSPPEAQRRQPARWSSAPGPRSAVSRCCWRSLR